jgi:hypothetical protein
MKVGATEPLGSDVHVALELCFLLPVNISNFDRKKNVERAYISFGYGD